MEIPEDSDLNVFKSTKGGVKLEINGFIYEKNQVQNEKYYWVCEMRRNKQYSCNTRIITVYNEEKNRHSLVNKNIKKHNHEPDVLKAKVADVVNSIKQESIANPTKKPSQIINDCIATTSEGIMAHIPTQRNLRQVIHRSKKKTKKLIKEPENIDFELDLSILQCDDVETELIVMDKFNNGKRVIIYTTKVLLNSLGQSKFYLLDGTFKITPKIFHQLYTIHGSTHQNKTFPMVIGLFTHKDKVSYDTFFEMLLECCESAGINLCPRYCIMDFEKAPRLSIRKYFDNIAIKGCNFHLGQIVHRRIQNQGFQTLYGKNVTFAIEMKCLLALSYLSPENIPAYFDEWRRTISPEAEVIAQWFSENYIRGTSSSPPKYKPHQWSTKELMDQNIPRTQNSAEAWHHRINSMAGANHIGFYNLSIQLIKELKFSLTEVQKQKLSIGAPQPAKKKKVLDRMHRIQFIIDNQADYTKNGFLRAIGANLRLV